MKKWKSLSVLIFGALASIFFVGCSCSNKEISPTKISVDVAETFTFIDESRVINYTIEPPDSSNTKVDVSVNKPDKLTLSHTSFDSATGTLTVTGKAEDTEGVLVTFTISGTGLKTSTLVKIMPDPVKLTQSASLYYSNGSNSVMFKNVPNTTNYLVNIDGTDYPLTDTSTSTAEHYVSLPVFDETHPLTYDEVHTVKVKALGDAINFLDGDYSEEYKFLKYSPIENLTAENGVFTWLEHSTAPYYRVKVNGAGQGTYCSTNTFTISAQDAGVYEVEVAAAHNSEVVEGCHIFQSEFSEKYAVTKLATPQLELNNQNKVNNVITNSYVTFPAVLGASGYKVTVSPALPTSGAEFEVSENKIEVSEEFTVGTNYTITVLPLGDITTTVAGSSSQIVVKRIATVDGFNIENNVLTFNGIAISGGYEIILSDGTNTKTVTTTTTSVNLAEELNAVGTYNISVRALGLVTETINVANGVPVETGKTIIKLANTNITAVQNDGTVVWDEVTGAASYAVYLNGNYVDSTLTTSYTLNPVDVATGANGVKVVSVGDGVSSITSGVANAANYAFNKLAAANEYFVANDILKFTAVSGALDYNVKLNNGSYRLIGSDPTVGYELNSGVIDGVNKIYVISVGDDVRNISSDVAIFNVSRLEAPTNLRTENGVITWDYTEGLKYKFYLGDEVEGTEVETNTTISLSITGQNVRFKVKAVPSVGNYISSAYTEKTVYKLQSVNTESIAVSVESASNTLSNYKLTWAAVDNATKYMVTVVGSAETYTYEPTEAKVLIPESYAAGDYAVSIYAVGTTSTSDVGYVNSNTSSSQFRKLGKPSGLTTTQSGDENLLTWNPSTGDEPSGYMLEVTYYAMVSGELATEGVTTYKQIGAITGYIFDPTDYQLGKIDVRVRSLGNNTNLITGEYSVLYTLNRAEAITGLRIENGAVTWNNSIHSNATYLIYTTKTPDDASSYVKNEATVNKGATTTTAVLNLEVGVQYTVKIVVFAPGLLNSEASSTIKVTELASVTGFNMFDSVISWNFVEHAEGYIVSDSNNNHILVEENYMNFSAFGNTLPGDYTFTIYPVGSQTSTTVGYVNGKQIATGLSVTILSSPTSASIVNNVLTIVDNNPTPALAYEILFTHATLEDYVIGIELEGLDIDLAELDEYLPAGKYKIEIFSLGNEEDLISNRYSGFTLDGITKLDETMLGLRVFNGELNWTADVNKKFDIYVDGVVYEEDLETNTITIDTLEKNVEYKIQLVAKQEGCINSSLSPVLTVLKLPDATGFRMQENLVNEYTGEREYSFKWDSKVGSGLNTDIFSFLITPSEDTPVEPFNGAVPGVNNTYSFDYANTVIGNYEFNIQLMGSISETTYGYLNGDKLENTLKVTILSPLTFTSYDRTTNKLCFTNENTKATEIQIAYYDTMTGMFVFSEKIPGNSQSYIVDYSKYVSAGHYDIYFNAVGDVNNNVLMHSDLTSRLVELLDVVVNVRTENGYISWTHGGGEGVGYQIYLDDKLVTYEMEVPDTGEGDGTEPALVQNRVTADDDGDGFDDETGEPITPGSGGDSGDGDGSGEGSGTIITVVDTFTAVLEARIINDLINDNLEHEIYIKAIKQGAIDSGKSNIMKVRKLGVIDDARFNNHKLYWKSIDNSQGYVVRCSNADMASIFGEAYDADLNGIKFNNINDGVEGKSLPASVPAGPYGFYVIPLGNTVNAPTIGYLTGTTGNIADTTVLSAPIGIAVSDGIIVWNEIDGAVRYDVTVTKGEIFDKTKTEFSGSVINPYYSLEPTTFADEWHTVRVVTIGDGKNYLNSSSSDISEITVYKVPSPNTYSYKVLDGFISWTVPIESGYVAMATKDMGYSAQDMLNGAKGTEDAQSETLVKNLEHFRNVEVTINGNVYKNQKPFKIELDKNEKNLIYSYDFNFTNITNPYAVSVRFIGGSTPVDEGGEGEGDGGDAPVEAFNTLTNHINKVTADEDGDGFDDETGEPIEPGDGEGAGPEEKMINVVNSNYSKSISGHKLPAPQSPVVEIQTMVENDCLYFAAVDAGSFDVRYLITATCTDESKPVVTYILDSSNKNKYVATADDNVGSASGSVYKVPVGDIQTSSTVFIEPGFIYKLTVRALGTPNSGSATSGVYFTSLYDRTCEVERLQSPTVIVQSGQISFVQVATALKQELRIWSAGIGDVYNKDEADKDKSDKLFAEQITITEETVEANPYLTLMEDGYYYYSLIDNPLFPDGEYYATCEAIGNGVTKISSAQSPTDIYGKATFKMTKLKEINNLKINAGKFSWNAVSYNGKSGQEYAERYYVTIMQRFEGDTVNPPITYEEVVDAANVQVGSDCFFDLDSLKYPAREKNNRYEYSIKVSAGGTLNSVEVEDKVITLSGDSNTTPTYYKRLLAPQGIEMVDGVLRWLNVTEATKYEVYKLDGVLSDGSDQGGGEELPSYSIITDDNYRQLNFRADLFTSGQVFTLRIRAIPGSLSETYLNGEFSPEILCKKLETPNLRVVDGIVKWNSTDLSYSIATGTKVVITNVATGEIVYANENLKITDEMNTDTGLDFHVLAEKLNLEFEAGYYKVEVGYIGSNGEVEIVVGGGDDAGNGDDAGEPDGGDDAGNGDDVGGGDDAGEPDGTDPTLVQNRVTADDDGDGFDDDTGEPIDPGAEPTPDEPGAEPDPDAPVEPDAPADPDAPVETERYSWFSSNIVSMIVYKLETPEADLYIEEDLENPANYVSVKLLENAMFYEFTAFKTNADGSLKTHSFEKINVTAIAGNEYYKTVTIGTDEYLLFNLKAVADEDAKIPDQLYPFGQEFSVYVRAFDYDRVYTYTGGDIYAVSDKSNSVTVEVPITPTDLQVNTRTGLISWVNKSKTTKTQLKIYYNDSAEPEIHILDEGVSTFKLSTIGKFEVSVLSFKQAANGVYIRSAYSDPVEGNFIIFGSGSGTVADPYVLTESAHMLNIDYYLDSHYVFGNSIEMNNSDLEKLGGIMIARGEDPFNGTIDGKGYSLTNVHLAYNASEIAIVGTLGSSGVIKNLNVGIKTGAQVYQCEIFAGLVVYNYGTITNITTIAPVQGSQNCDGLIKYYPVVNQSVSGLVYDNYGTISDVVNNMTITYSGVPSQIMKTMVSGIVSNNWGTVIQSANKGELKGTIVGGIAYSNQKVITLSYNTGKITAVAIGAGNQALAGGIAARNMALGGDIGSITYCYSILTTLEASSSSTLAEDKAYAGGIVADNGVGTSTLMGCYVVMRSTASINNGVFGVIVGMDGEKDKVAVKYSGNYYISGVAVNEMGNDASCDIAQQENSVNNLTSSLVQNHSTIYVADTNTINSGYPVFVWQSDNA